LRNQILQPISAFFLKKERYKTNVSAVPYLKLAKLYVLVYSLNQADSERNDPLSTWQLVSD